MEDPGGPEEDQTQDEGSVPPSLATFRNGQGSAHTIAAIKQNKRLPPISGLRVYDITGMYTEYGVIAEDPVSRIFDDIMARLYPGVKRKSEFALQIYNVDAPPHEWLDPSKPLNQQKWYQNCPLMLRRKYFVTPAFTHEPADLQLSYDQVFEDLLQGKVLVSQETLISIVAHHLYIKNGAVVGQELPHEPDWSEVLPLRYRGCSHQTKMEILKRWHLKSNPKGTMPVSTLQAMVDAYKIMFKNVAWGVYWFRIKTPLPGGASESRDVEHSRGEQFGWMRSTEFHNAELGITSDALLFALQHDEDPERTMREVKHKVPLKHLRSFCLGTQCVTFDFGDHAPYYLTVQTNDGPSMSQYLTGYGELVHLAADDTEQQSNFGEQVTVEVVFNWSIVHYTPQPHATEESFASSKMSFNCALLVGECISKALDKCRTKVGKNAMGPASLLLQRYSGELVWLNPERHIGSYAINVENDKDILCLRKRIYALRVEFTDQDTRNILRKAVEVDWGMAVREVTYLMEQRFFYFLDKSNGYALQKKVPKDEDGKRQGKDENNWLFSDQTLVDQGFKEYEWCVLKVKPLFDARLTLTRDTPMEIVKPFIGIPCYLPKTALAFEKALRAVTVDDDKEDQFKETELIPPNAHANKIEFETWVNKDLVVNNLRPQMRSIVTARALCWLATATGDRVARCFPELFTPPVMRVDTVESDMTAAKMGIFTGAKGAQEKLGDLRKSHRFSDRLRAMVVEHQGRVLDLTQLSLYQLPISFICLLSCIPQFHNLDLSSRRKELDALRIDKTHNFENDLGAIKPFIGLLANLRSLSFAGNDIVDVPPMFEHLPRLQLLDLRYNRIKTLPKECPKVSDLMLEGNPIKALPVALWLTMKEFNADIKTMQRSLSIPWWFVGLPVPRRMQWLATLFPLFGILMVCLGGVYGGTHQELVVGLMLIVNFSVLVTQTVVVGIFLVTWPDLWTKVKNRVDNIFSAKSEADVFGADQEKSCLTCWRTPGAPKPGKVRFTRQNIVAFIGLITEAVQLSALAFNPKVPWPKPAASGFSVASFNFGESGFIPLFWLAALGAILLRIALEVGVFIKKYNFSRYTIKFYSTIAPILFIPLTRYLFTPLPCVYDGDPIHVVDYPALVCWKTLHIVYVVTALLVISVYHAVAVVGAPTWQLRDPFLDLKLKPRFIILSNEVKFCLTAVSSFFGKDLMTNLITSLIILVLLLALQLYYRPSGPDLWYIDAVRICMYCCALAASVGSLIVVLMGYTGLWSPVFIVIGVFVVIFGITALYIFIRRRHQQEKAIMNFEAVNLETVQNPNANKLAGRKLIPIKKASDSDSDEAPNEIAAEDDELHDLEVEEEEDIFLEENPRAKSGELRRNNSRLIAAANAAGLHLDNTPEPISSRHHHHHKSHHGHHHGRSPGHSPGRRSPGHSPGRHSPTGRHSPAPDTAPAAANPNEPVRLESFNLSPLATRPVPEREREPSIRPEDVEPWEGPAMDVGIDGRLSYISASSPQAVAADHDVDLHVSSDMSDEPAPRHRPNVRRHRRRREPVCDEDGNDAARGAASLAMPSPSEGDAGMGVGGDGRSASASPYMVPAPPRSQSRAGRVDRQPQSLAGPAVPPVPSAPFDLVTGVHENRDRGASQRSPPPRGKQRSKKDHVRAPAVVWAEAYATEGSGSDLALLAAAPSGGGIVSQQLPPRPRSRQRQMTEAEEDDSRAFVPPQRGRKPRTIPSAEGYRAVGYRELSNVPDESNTVMRTYDTGGVPPAPARSNPPPLGRARRAQASREAMPSEPHFL